MPIGAPPHAGGDTRLADFAGCIRHPRADAMRGCDAWKNDERYVIPCIATRQPIDAHRCADAVLLLHPAGRRPRVMNSASIQRTSGVSRGTPRATIVRTIARRCLTRHYGRARRRGRHLTLHAQRSPVSEIQAGTASQPANSGMPRNRPSPNGGKQRRPRPVPHSLSAHRFVHLRTDRARPLSRRRNGGSAPALRQGSLRTIEAERCVGHPVGLARISMTCAARLAAGG